MPGEDKKTPQDDKLIVKSNRMVEASYRFKSIHTERLVTLALSQLRKDSSRDDFELLFEVPIAQLADIVPAYSNSKALYSRVAEAADELGSASIKLVSDRPPKKGKDRNWVVLPLIAFAEHKDGVFRVKFNPELAAHFVQLQENFTKYQLLSAMRLSSQYSVRLYQLLKQFQSSGWREILLTDLQDFLLHPKYSTKELMRRIINPACQEISEKTDITVLKVERITEKRVTVAIRFDFTNKNASIARISEKEKEEGNLSPQIEALVAQGISRGTAEDLAQKYSFERIEVVIKWALQFILNGHKKINNIPGLIVKALNEDYSIQRELSIDTPEEYELFEEEISSGNIPSIQDIKEKAENLKIQTETKKQEKEQQASAKQKQTFEKIVADKKLLTELQKEAPSFSEKSTWTWEELNKKEKILLAKFAYKNNLSI